MPIKTEEKPSVVYELLGGSPADLLLPSNFLIVEGKSEYEFISRVTSRFYSGQKQIQVIYAEGDHGRQRESMDSINKAFVPLHASPVYKERLVILCDTPNRTRTADFDAFKRAYSYLETNEQLFVIPNERLEEYYPAPWKKTVAESQAMNGEKNRKLDLAREVGSSITKEQFESEMSIIYGALKACWNKAY